MGRKADTGFKMNVVAIIKYAFTLVGIAMLAAAFYFYQGTRSFLETATKTDGTVVELIRSRSGDSDTYKPVVHFVDQKGEGIEFTSSTSSNPPSYSVNEMVGVWYDPANPQHAELDGFFSLWGISAIFGGLGAIFFLNGSTPSHPKCMSSRVTMCGLIQPVT